MQMDGIIIKPKRPNNIIQLKDGNTVQINKILIRGIDKNNLYKPENIYFLCQLACEKKEAFHYPISSLDIGIAKINSFSPMIQIIDASNLKRKSILLNINNESFTISLLHKLS